MSPLHENVPYHSSSPFKLPPSLCAPQHFAETTSNVPTSISSTTAILPPSTNHHQHHNIQNNTPTDNDVLFEGGKLSFRHAGNRRLRTIALARYEMFVKASTKPERLEIVRRIIRFVTQRSAGCGGRFLQRKSVRDAWKSVSSRGAHEIVVRILKHHAHQQKQRRKAAQQSFALPAAAASTPKPYPQVLPTMSRHLEQSDGQKQQQQQQQQQQRETVPQSVVFVSRCVTPHYQSLQQRQLQQRHLQQLQQQAMIEQVVQANPLVNQLMTNVSTKAMEQVHNDANEHSSNKLEDDDDDETTNSSSTMSDEQLLAMFQSNNTMMLSSFKQDRSAEKLATILHPQHNVGGGPGKANEKEDQQSGF